MATTSQSTPENFRELDKEISEVKEGLGNAKNVVENPAKEVCLEKIVEKMVEAGKGLPFTQFKKAAWDAIDVASKRAIIS